MDEVEERWIKLAERLLGLAVMLVSLVAGIVGLSQGNSRLVSAIFLGLFWLFCAYLAFATRQTPYGRKKRFLRAHRYGLVVFIILPALAIPAVLWEPVIQPLVVTSLVVPGSGCPYQGRNDDETIKNLIRAEADAVNRESLDTILAIFAPDASIQEGDDGPTWNSPLARYRDDLFENVDFKDVEHFDISQVKWALDGDQAWYASGSRGFLNVGDEWQSFVNGSLISDPPTEYGSDHWTFRRNSQGCWVIVRLAFNAGHVPFPP